MRIRPDFQDFLDAIQAKTSCDLTAISSAYSSMSADNQAKVNAASSAVIENEDMATAIHDLTISITGTSCLLVGPDLVSRFLELTGTILVFKQPEIIAYTDISSTCSNDICSAG